MTVQGSTGRHWAEPQHASPPPHGLASTWGYHSAVRRTRSGRSCKHCKHAWTPCKQRTAIKSPLSPHMAVEDSGSTAPRMAAGLVPAVARGRATPSNGRPDASSGRDTSGEPESPAQLQRSWPQRRSQGQGSPASSTLQQWLWYAVPAQRLRERQRAVASLRAELLHNFRITSQCNR